MRCGCPRQPSILYSLCRHHPLRMYRLGCVGAGPRTARCLRFSAAHIRRQQRAIRESPLHFPLSTFHCQFRLCRSYIPWRQIFGDRRAGACPRRGSPVMRGRYSAAASGRPTGRSKTLSIVNCQFRLRRSYIPWRQIFGDRRAGACPRRGSPVMRGR